MHRVVLRADTQHGQRPRVHPLEYRVEVRHRGGVKGTQPALVAFEGVFLAVLLEFWV